LNAVSGVCLARAYERPQVHTLDPCLGVSLSYRSLRLVLEELLDCRSDVLGLGEDYVF
jgi:hypothetical protein